MLKLYCTSMWSCNIEVSECRTKKVCDPQTTNDQGSQPSISTIYIVSKHKHIHVIKYNVLYVLQCVLFTLYNSTLFSFDKPVLSQRHPYWIPIWAIFRYRCNLVFPTVQIPYQPVEILHTFNNE